MALVFDETPLQDSAWRQVNNAQIEHTKRIRVTGFISSTYYAMLNELYSDPGLPALGSPVDPLFPNVLLRAWRIATIQCGSPISEILIEATYRLQVINVAQEQVPDADGDVIYRMRTLTTEEIKTVDRLGTGMAISYKGNAYVLNVTIPRSLILLECERYEDENPEPRVRPLLSQVNSVTWNGRAPRTVLFYDFNADTRDGGLTYFCNYSFLYDAGTHDEEFFYRGPDGKTPDDFLTDPNATQQPEAIGQASFSPLNITIPF